MSKSDSEADHRTAQAQAQTPAYAQMHKEQPAREHRLAELVNRHDLRHARYRGQEGVRYHSLLTGVMVNLKRRIRLLFGSVAGATKKLQAVLQWTVRVEMVPVSERKPTGWPPSPRPTPLLDRKG